MLSKLVNIVAIVASACLVFGFVFIESHMSQRPQSPTNHATYNAKERTIKSKTQKDETNEAIALYTKLLAVFTGVLAVATIGLGGATVGLYLAGERQLRLGRQEFIATHRPKVIVRSIQGPFHDDEAREFVWITVVNIGETNAIIYGIGSDLARRTSRNGWVPPGVQAEARDIPQVVLKSGDRHTFKVSARCLTSDATIFAEVTMSQQLCAVGCIKYRDSNGRSLETGFLRIYDEAEGFLPSANPEDEYQD